MKNWKWTFTLWIAQAAFQYCLLRFSDAGKNQVYTFCKHNFYHFGSNSIHRCFLHYFDSVKKITQVNDGYFGSHVTCFPMFRNLVSIRIQWQIRSCFSDGGWLSWGKGKLYSKTSGIWAILSLLIYKHGMYLHLFFFWRIVNNHNMVLKISICDVISPPVSLRYDRQKSFTLKVYNLVLWFTYILWSSQRI